MLTHIQIRNFAIIDALEIELGPGLTVLTGETGAGKSILVDALLLAAGGRAAADAVRHGADRAEVTATFSIDANHPAQEWLSEQAIEHDGECVLRRTTTADGRSRAWVNGQTMPVQAVRQLGEMLLDVHGQMEYQSLMRRPAQRELLDRHGDHANLVAEVAARWRGLRTLREEHERIIASASERSARLEMLRFHLGELDALDLKRGEAETLLEERDRLAQRGRLVDGASEIAALLRDAEDANAEQILARTASIARSLEGIDSAIGPVARLIDESLIAVREATTTLARYGDSLDADPARQEWLESRLAAIESIARKHRTDPAALDNLHESLRAELSELEALDIAIEEVLTRMETAREAFLRACERLSAARRKAAVALSLSVTSLMQSLGMPGGRFEIGVHTVAADDAGERGQDAIEFLVTANPGQPLRPLAKVASGGELSRISLAIQVAAVEDSALPCLVFDEVDAGIGGGVAEIVGRQLRTLGQRAQVLCVTHLPQVASQAHWHFRVAKLTDGRTTRTTLTGLEADERVAEVARMLGGVEISTKAREHASEMLQEATRAKAGDGRRKRRKGS